MHSWTLSIRTLSVGSTMRGEARGEARGRGTYMAPHPGGVPGAIEDALDPSRTSEILRRQQPAESNEGVADLTDDAPACFVSAIFIIFLGQTVINLLSRMSVMHIMILYNISMNDPCAWAQITSTVPSSHSTRSLMTNPKSEVQRSLPSASCWSLHTYIKTRAHTHTLWHDFHLSQMTTYWIHNLGT